MHQLPPLSMPPGVMEKKELLTSQPQEIKESADTVVYDASQVIPEI